MDTISDGAPSRAPHPARRYDWRRILDGSVRRFPLDELPGSPENFARQVRAAAKRRGLAVRVVIRSRAGVYVQRTGVAPSGRSYPYRARVAPKQLREALCAAQSALSSVPAPERYVRDLQALIAACDELRPLGADGKHGGRHTSACGCE